MKANAVIQEVKQSTHTFPRDKRECLEKQSPKSWEWLSVSKASICTKKSMYIRTQDKQDYSHD